MVVVGLLAVVVVGLFFWREIEGRRREVAELLSKLSSLEKTVEVDGVFEKQVVDLSEVSTKISDLRDYQEGRIGEMSKRLDDMNRQTLAIAEVLVSQRKLSGKARVSTQSVLPSKEPDGAERKRVDFDSTLSRFRVTGHTLTDPAETFLSLEETTPLRLTIALSKDKGGKWLTDVKTDDGNSVDVKVSVVDPKVLSGGWKEKLSLSLSAGLIPDRTVGVGVMYGSRVSLGPSCQIFEGGSSCGVTMTWRPFFR